MHVSSSTLCCLDLIQRPDQLEIPVMQEVEKKVEGVTVPVYGSNSDSLTGSNPLKDRALAPGASTGSFVAVQHPPGSGRVDSLKSRSARGPPDVAADLQVHQVSAAAAASR